MKNIPAKLTGPRYVKAEHIAAIYNISKEIVYRWAKSGKIPCVRFQETVRFSESAVRSTIEGGEQ